MTTIRTIHFNTILEFTYILMINSHKNFFLKKAEKYVPLLHNIYNRDWNVPNITVIIARAKSTIHKPSIQEIKETFQILETNITNTLININTIIIHHLMSIILHKQRLGKQPIPFHTMQSAVNHTQYLNYKI